MNKKSWIIFSIIVIAIVGGMIYISTQNRLNVSDITNDQLNTAIVAESRNGNIADHEIGSKSAKVTIVEYADYHCPGCSAAAPKTEEIAKKYENVYIYDVSKSTRIMCDLSSAISQLLAHTQMHELPQPSLKPLACRENSGR